MISFSFLFSITSRAALFWIHCNRATWSAGKPAKTELQLPRREMIIAATSLALALSDINQPSLPTSFFYSVLVSISVSMVLSIVFHSINSPDNSPLSDSVLSVITLPYWSFQFYVSS